MGSTVVHIVALALIIIGTILGQRAVKEIVKPKETVELIAPSDMPTLEPSKTLSGGGGGGGDRDKLQASQGRFLGRRWSSSRLPWWWYATNIQSCPWSRPL